MATIQQFLMAFMARLKDKDGQALVEYALILALIAIVVIVALTFLGGAVHNTLNNVANAVNNTAG
ncbi:MAG: Flp family type IVb pilin [Sulfobacillus thermotolerans]|nr:Flp family type IVb pilin [Sulfobacillus thermotolerans]